MWRSSMSFGCGVHNCAFCASDEMRSFSLGPFKYSHVTDAVSLDGRSMRTWQLSYEGQELGMETLRSSARNSTICEVFELKRTAFIEKLKQTQQPGDLEYTWIARTLPAPVLSQDAATWQAPSQSQLAHVVGIGSFTGVVGEKAAQLIGVTPQHFRKYTSSSSTKQHTAIPFAAWHLLLQRLNIQGFAAGSSPKQAAPQVCPTVTSVALRSTLELTQEVSQYLKRLPPVPVTRQLIDRIDHHLGHAETLAAVNLAKQIEQEGNARQQLRQAISYSNAGLGVLKVCVQGDTVQLRFALDRIEDHDEQFRKIYKREVLMQLYRGLELKLETS